jgi:hypothetical protein
MMFEPAYRRKYKYQLRSRLRKAAAKAGLTDRLA